MQKEGGGKLAQKTLQFMVLKSTLLLTYTHTSNSITLQSLILTMKRSTKLTSASSIIFPVEHSWLTILAGAHVLLVLDLSLTNKCSNPL
jgi:hypothetical protein